MLWAVVAGHVFVVVVCGGFAAFVGQVDRVCAATDHNIRKT